MRGRRVEVGAVVKCGRLVREWLGVDLPWETLGGIAVGLARVEYGLQGAQGVVAGCARRDDRLRPGLAPVRRAALHEHAVGSVVLGAKDG